MRYTYKNTLHACYRGFITQAINNNLAPLLFIVFQTQFGLSLEMLGRLVLLNFGTQIIADIVAIKYADRIGYRLSALLAHLFCALGLVSLGVLPHILPNPYVGLSIAVIIYATGGGIIEVILSPIVESLPGDAKASAMSLLHSFYCWGQMGVVIITTFLIWLFGTEFWYLLPIGWALIPAYNFFKFRSVPLRPLIQDGVEMSIKDLFQSKVFLIALILMLAAGASELTMSQWSSLFAEQGLQIPKLVGDLIGPALFALFMGIGRTIYGMWGHKFDLSKALVISGVLCVLCYSVTVFVPNPFISLFGCALTGLSVSLMWPGTLSMSSQAFPLGGTAMFGILAIFGDIGAAVGPWLAGVVADNSTWGLRGGLLVGIIFPILLVAGLLQLRSRHRLVHAGDPV